MRDKEFGELDAVNSDVWNRSYLLTVLSRANAVIPECRCRESSTGDFLGSHLRHSRMTRLVRSKVPKRQVLRKLGQQVAGRHGLLKRGLNRECASGFKCRVEFHQAD